MHTFSGRKTNQYGLETWTVNLEQVFKYNDPSCWKISFSKLAERRSKLKFSETTAWLNTVVAAFTAEKSQIKTSLAHIHKNLI